MEEIITLLLSLFIGYTAANAQTVNDIPLNDIEVEYVEIVGSSKMFSNKLTIDIDFGQENKFFSGKDTQLRDKEGNKLKFNSMIDALNFMSQNGYEFVDAFAISMSKNHVYHYLLKRKSRSTGKDVK